MRYGAGVRLARGIGGAAVLLVCAGTLSSPPPPPGPDPSRALERVREQDFGPVFQTAYDRIDAAFDARRQEAFLAQVFGVGAKWKALTRSRASFERHVRRTFEKTVFEPAAFEAEVLGRIRADWDAAARAAENRVLAAVWEDFRAARPQLDLEALTREHRRIASALAPKILKDLGVNAVSIAASEATAVAFTSALASAGILGAGGASGPWTLGVSLVVAVAVGWTIDATAGSAWEEAARAQVRTQVSVLRNRMLQDVDAALVKAVEAWRRVQEASVAELYRGGVVHVDRIAARP